MKTLNHIILIGCLVFGGCQQDIDPTRTTFQGFEHPAETSFRVVSWNVNRDSFSKHPEQFRAMMAAIDPDIFLLDEVTENSSAEQVIQSLYQLKGEADTLWNISFGAGGEYQRSIIASRLPVRKVNEFQWIDFPQEKIDKFISMVDAKRKSRLRDNLEGGVAANAAVVEIDGKKVLNIVVDFQCCGDDNTWEDQRREFEANAVFEAASEALNRLEVDGVILGGDLNLVGTRKPLQILLEPLPKQYGSLTVVEAKHLDGKSNWTWDGRGTEYPSGQLDFALYNSRQLEVLRAFVFDTETMPEDFRERYNLDINISKTLSDHRPIVVDFRWREVDKS